MPEGTMEAEKDTKGRVMDAFGDFELLAELGEQEGRVEYHASHPQMTGPLRLTLFEGLSAAERARITNKCERFVGLSHPHLEPQLGYGTLGTTPYRVAPLFESVRLKELLASLKKRRVILPMDNVFAISRALCKALHALHHHRNGAPKEPLVHGAVDASTVRVLANGNVILAGIGSWHEQAPDDAMEQVWDGSGLAALIYELLRATKTSGELPVPSVEMDSLLRVALGIGDAADLLTPKIFGNRLREIAVRQHVYTTLDRFKDLAKRTCDVIAHEKEVLSLARQEAEEEKRAARAQAKADEGFDANRPVGETDEEPEEEDAVSIEIDVSDFTSADEPDTQKSRPEFLQWIKMKALFPDNLLQLCMDSYDNDAERLTALWQSKNVNPNQLCDELAKWLGTNVWSGDRALSAPALELLVAMPISFWLRHQILPLSRSGKTLRCGSSNPFQTEANEALKRAFGCDQLIFDAAQPRRVVECGLKSLQDCNRGGVVSPTERIITQVLVFDPVGNFPSTLGHRMADKGWLLQWSDSPKEFLNTASSSTPAAVIGTTEAEDLQTSEVLVDLKTQPSGHAVPCFVIGGENDDEAVERILDLGVDDYFSLPINADAVVAKLRRVFNRTNQADSTPPSLSGGPAPPPIPSEGMMEDLILNVLLGEVEQAGLTGGMLGPLGAVDVLDLIEHFILRRETLLMEINGTVSGTLALMDGEVVFAETESSKGAEAFHALSLAENGTFELTFNREPPDTNLASSTVNLLIHCMNAKG